ncbi:2'-5' RNA ligase family protein [Actinomyces respiraculi]|uniref:2'-5' RNA ligase family protein n=1 Tax=Actinomyces respiraculi TaxID=2744574 RepID=UPI00141FC954|nr:2'-5' RNA ligase family protein [Actinomyces respiraculi]
MEVPETDAHQCVVGVTVPLPQPWAAQVRTIRLGAGDPLALSIPPHVTLVPPTAVDARHLEEVRAHVARVARDTAPFLCEVGGVDSFRPVTPVAYLAVGDGAAELDALQAALRVETGPLAVDLRYPFRPHLTLAHEVDDEALDDALAAGKGIRGQFVVDCVRLDRMGDDGLWHLLGLVPLGAR